MASLPCNQRDKHDGGATTTRIKSYETRLLKGAPVVLQGSPSSSLIRITQSDPIWSDSLHRVDSPAAVASSEASRSLQTTPFHHACSKHMRRSVFHSCSYILSGRCNVIVNRGLRSLLPRKARVITCQRCSTLVETASREDN